VCPTAFRRDNGQVDCCCVDWPARRLGAGEAPYRNRIACRKRVSQTLIKQLIQVSLRLRPRNTHHDSKQGFRFCNFVGVIAVEPSGAPLFLKPSELL